MRIDVLGDNKMNVEAVGKQDIKSVKGNTLSESVISEVGCMTMNSTGINKTGLFENLATDGTFDSVKENADLMKDNLEAVFAKMDTGIATAMHEDGVDVNNTETDEMVTVVEQIQTRLAMYCDDFVPTARLDSEDIKASVGQSAAAYKVSAKLNDSEKAYLVKNEMEPTVENAYLAMHSGNTDKTESKITDAEWEEIKPQVVKILEESGVTTDDTNLLRCRFMIDNRIDINPKNFMYLQTLDELEVPEDDFIIERIAATVIEGRKPSQTLITGEPLPWEKAADVIISLEKAIEKADVKDIKAYRELQEARLLMTLEAGRTLIKQGIEINTIELSDLVEQLKALEERQLNSYVPEGQSEVSIEEVNMVNDILIALENLKHAPSAVIGMVAFDNEKVTVNRITMATSVAQIRFAEASSSYDVLSTEVRPDLGDSISKAVKASTDDILSGMGYENNEANRRAVRILAYNEMAMTEENVDRIKALDISVNRLFDEMTPHATLKMLRDGINPLDTEIETLHDYLKDLNEGQNEEEKYSEFLYKLEKKGDITEQEREQYIAVYSLMNRFRNEGMNAVGQLLNQGLELTMGNLLTAYMSLHDKGMDITVDEKTGMAEVSDKVTYYKHLFAGIKKNVIPDGFEDMSIEEFVSKVNSSEDTEGPSLIMENVRQAAMIETEIFRMAAEYRIPATINNLMALRGITKAGNNIFDDDKGDSIEDLIDDREKLISEYESVAEDAREQIKEALYKTDSYINMEELRHYGIRMNVVTALAKNNNFYLPYEQNGVKGIINLKIIENGEQTGKFEVSFECEAYGKVTIEGKVTPENIAVSIMSNSEDGIKRLDEHKESITELLSNEFEEISINVSRVDSQPDIHPVKNEKVATDKIFRAAKIFIKELTK